MKTIILDLDNCIANDEWRIPFIDWSAEDPMSRYHDYHSLAAFDKVGNTHLFEELSVENRLVICTARPVLYRAATEHWLDTNGVGYDIIMMRDNNDHRHSLQLKQSQLDKLINQFGVHKDDIICAYDDRQDVIDMYLANGIPAERAWLHDTCAFSKPTEVA